MVLLLRVANGRVAAIVPLVIAALVLFPAAQPGLHGQFTSGVSLVEVYATVTDGAGRPIVGLGAADFQVAEDDAPQTVSVFAAGEFPLSVVIALDRSFSMAGARLAKAKGAARAFIAALRPDDEVMVLAIGSEVETIVPPVPARDAAATRWDAIDAWGTTPLYDVTLRALEAIQSRRGRRALLVISDGADRGSDTTATQLVGRARRSDVLVYPIGLGRARTPLFAELAAVTGGRSFFVDDPRRLESTLATIARELRFQYLLGYVPAQPPPGSEEWRSIRVTVDRTDARVRARDGYVARR